MMGIQKIGKRFVLVQTGIICINSTNSLDTVLKKLSSGSLQSVGKKARKGLHQTSVPLKTTPFFQLVSLLPLVSEKQVWLAAEQACAATDSGMALSKKPEFELLLRLAGKRQIKESLELLSLKETGAQQAVLVGIGPATKTLKIKAQNIGHSLGFRAKPGLFHQNFSANKKRILQSYAISEKQISAFAGWTKKDAIEALVLEKIALVGLEE